MPRNIIWLCCVFKRMYGCLVNNGQFLNSKLVWISEFQLESTAVACLRKFLLSWKMRSSDGLQSLLNQCQCSRALRCMAWGNSFGVSACHVKPQILICVSVRSLGVFVRKGDSVQPKHIFFQIFAAAEPGQALPLQKPVPLRLDQ